MNRKSQKPNEKAATSPGTHMEQPTDSDTNNLSSASDDAIDQAIPAKRRRVIIEDEWIYVEGFHPEYSDKARARQLDMTCRTVADEACAWAVKRLGEEMEKSLAYYHTGDPVDNICIE